MTIGTVRLVAGRAWHIECEPHIRARIKRVFPRLPQWAGSKLVLSATPENTRELQWFLQRYPMDVDDAGAMARLAKLHEEQESRMADLIAGHIAPADIQLAEPARDYQALVPSFLAVRGGLLLGDDLGLGKTVSAICCLQLDGALPAVVVCPAHLPRQWEAMIKRFLPALSTHIVKTSQPYDLTPKRRRKTAQAELLPENSLPDVLIMSYHKARGWADTVAAFVGAAIYDEVQQLRHDGTEIYRAARVIAGGARYRLGLSATPIYNYGSEFWPVLDALIPDVLGTREEFLREWCAPAPGGKSRLSDPTEFGAYLRREGLMLRRRRKDVGRELPKLAKVVHEIDANRRALDQLRGDAVALAKVVLQRNEQFRGQKMQAAGEFDNLMRQATGIAKAPYVVEFMKLLLDSGEQAVLFGWHRAVYDIWAEGLAEFSPVFYTGTESARQKQEAIEAFVSGRSRVLIMSLRSGAGVDGLQAVCSTVVFGELDWSPGVHEQCIGRVDRDGQTDPSTAFFLISDAGADPIMAEVLGIKRDQIEGVREPDAALVERIETGENHLQRLAREFLEKRGERIPDNVIEMVTA